VEKSQSAIPSKFGQAGLSAEFVIFKLMEFRAKRYLAANA
jgi:hypothetical protein